jgi:hypothetical protein
MDEPSPNSEAARIIILAAFAVASAIAVLFSATCCYLWAIGRDVPQGLGAATTASLTFFFTTLAGMVKEATAKWSA